MVDPTPSPCLPVPRTQALRLHVHYVFKMIHLLASLLLAVWEMYTGESLYSDMAVGQVLYAVAQGGCQPQVHTTMGPILHNVPFLVKILWEKNGELVSIFKR